MSSAKGFPDTTSGWYLELKQVDVPQVDQSKLSWKEKVIEGLKLFTPTTSRAFLAKERYFLDTFSDQVNQYTGIRNDVQQLFLVSRAHRLALLSQLLEKLNISRSSKQWHEETANVSSVIDKHGQRPLQQPLEIAPKATGRKYPVVNPVPSDEFIKRAVDMIDAKDIGLLDEYCQSVQRTKVLKSHLEDVEKDLDNFAYLVNTQATAEMTYFRGLRDWAQGMVQLTKGLCSSLIAVSTLGAGLVYSTVFSATRGNIGLMTYTFPFFSLGFLVPAVIQIMIFWAANAKKEVKFASQPFWTITTGILLSLSTLAVMAALTLLNFTIFFLHADPDNPNTKSTPVPGIIAFGISGSVFVLIFAAALLSAIVTQAITTMRGIRRVVGAMYGSGKHREDELKLYVPV